MSSETVSAAEVARFDALAARWWDPTGPMRPLHQMNPTRVDWIARRIERQFGQVAGIRVLDVGCGAGLAAEALARRGCAVLGIDAAAEAIEAARDHAAKEDLPLIYRTAVAEDLIGTPDRFQVVTALEVIEHVPDPGGFVQSLRRLLVPGGLVVLSTLNRTPRSFLTAKLGAEYVLRLLPAGTHEWGKFIPPMTLAGYLRAAGLAVTDTAGLTPVPLTGTWRITRDLGVNYLIAASA